MLFWKDVFSKHWHNEAYILHLSTGEEEVALGGLQELYLRELFSNVFSYSMKTSFTMGEVRVDSCHTLRQLRTLLTHSRGDITKLRQKCFGFHLLKVNFLHCCHQNIIVPSEIAPWKKSCYWASWQRKQQSQDCWERIVTLILWTHNETQMKWVFGKWMQVCQLKFSEVLVV